ncbi:flagellar hook-length control protein FliK [Edaphovirga cremea]|uniref:flagellar hook-length control protein FliK n=1 Tax=Edaphovirga cremea TaxID=2267246 RepID=UPI001FE289C2|nr:flagellar hook-length control protein FliK [Edaphovirga cremea]
MNLNVSTVNSSATAASLVTTAEPPQAGAPVTADTLPQDFASQLDAQLGPKSPNMLLNGKTLNKKALDSILQESGGKICASPATLLAALSQPEASEDIDASLQAALSKACRGLFETDDPSDLAPTDKSTQPATTDLQSIQSLLAMLAAQHAPVLPATTSQRSMTSKTSDDADPLLTEVKSGKAGLGDLLTRWGKRADIGDESSPGQTLPGNGTKPAALHHSASTVLDPAVLAKADALATLAQTAGDKNSVAQHVLSAVNIPASSPAVAATSSALVTAPPTPPLNSPLGSPQWQQALSQQVLMFNRQGQQSAELRLHPQELGALHISLKIDDNQAQLHFASAHGQVRAAIEAAMPHLRTSLAESGIELGQSSVGSEPSSQWQQAQQQSQQGGGSPSSAGSPHHGTSGIAVADALLVPASLQNRVNGSQGVDIFA